MKLWIYSIASLILFSSAAAATPPQNAKESSAPPAWAYPINPPDDKLPTDNGTKYTVPGSKKALTWTQVLDSFNIPDWHPEGHLAMPPVVEHGRKPGVRGCGYCHLPNGQGRPENASLAGLPAEYIEQQVRDIKNGTRLSAEPRMGPPANMVIVSANASEEEVKTAAEYFSQLKYKPWIKVIETDTVPKTKIKGSMFVVADEGGKEPIGNRIIETPVNWKNTELRDDSSSFIAYVPVGSIKKGEALVNSGGAGRTVACAVCHGKELQGLGPIPRLAGRSPSQLFRQLYDFQHGTRKGPWSALMKEPVARLSDSDLVAIVAYIGSLKP